MELLSASGPVGLVIALGALLISGLAFRRAARQDRREHEFRAVTWTGDWTRSGEAKVVFELANTGQTTAEKVRVRIQVGRSANHPDGYFYANGIGKIRPGETKRIVVEEFDSPVEAEMALALVYKEGRAYRVNWVSPLGRADEYIEEGVQIF